MQATFAKLLLAALPAIVTCFAASADNYHAFLSGDPQEMQLAHVVRRTLLTLPYYGVFDDLEFRMDGDTVTLFGEVTMPELKEAADYAVKRIQGLTLVTDNIQVLPASPTDQQTRMAEYRAIYEEPELSIRYGYRAVPPIHIVVKNGTVRLEGLVTSEADRKFIEMRARSVPNVSTVTNNLQIHA